MNKSKQRQATHKARKAKAKAKHLYDFSKGSYYQSYLERNRMRKRAGLAPLKFRITPR